MKSNKNWLMKKDEAPSRTATDTPDKEFYLPRYPCHCACVLNSAILYISIDNLQKIAIKYHKQHAVLDAEIRGTPALNKL
jgi:hypothetical protein